MALVASGSASPFSVDYFQFNVRDQDGDVADFAPANGALIWVAATPGWALVQTGGQFGPISVTVEVHDSEPPQASGWEEAAESAFVAPAGLVRVGEWGSAPRPELPAMRTRPGETIHLRVHASGRAEAREHSYDFDDVIRERYLVQLWSPGVVRCV